MTEVERKCVEALAEFAKEILYAYWRPAPSSWYRRTNRTWDAILNERIEAALKSDKKIVKA